MLLISTRNPLEAKLADTFVVTNPEKCQLIQPPTTIMGTMLVMLPFTMSVIMLGSVIGLGGAFVVWVPS